MFMNIYMKTSSLHGKKVAKKIIHIAWDILKQKRENMNKLKKIYDFTLHHPDHP